MNKTENRNNRPIQLIKTASLAWPHQLNVAVTFYSVTRFDNLCFVAESDVLQCRFSRYMDASIKKAFDIPFNQNIFSRSKFFPLLDRNLLRSYRQFKADIELQQRHQSLGERCHYLKIQLEMVHDNLLFLLTFVHVWFPILSR
jgi:hypothetical protein